VQGQGGTARNKDGHGRAPAGIREWCRCKASAVSEISGATATEPLNHMHQFLNFNQLKDANRNFKNA